LMGQETVYSWQKIEAPDPDRAPPGRTGHAMAYDADGGRIVVFGGNGQEGVLNDLWAFDLQEM